MESIHAKTRHFGSRHYGTVDISGIDILGVDILGVDISALPNQFAQLCKSLNRLHICSKNIDNLGGKFSLFLFSENMKYFLFFTFLLFLNI